MEDKDIQTLNSYKLAEIRNKQIGFIFQNFALFSEYTALENVEIPLYYRNNLDKGSRLKGKEIRERALKYLEKLQMLEHKDKKPSQLSGGQQQRAAIARALVTEPNIILADEPTGALDQKTGTEIMNILEEITKEEKTVVIFTHDEKVARRCKRHIYIEDGRLLG